jgi:hypothetical protein
VADAFDHFQRIRHNRELDPVPDAMTIFFSGSRAAEPVPQAANDAIVSMLKLFAEREERDVGGAPIAYHLTSEGAFLCGYGYSVSDPILSKIGPGSILPHGTAEAGGFGLSVTELGHGAGVVIYWLQQPGGTIFRKIANGFEALTFGGPPSQFKARAGAALGQQIEIMFGDQPSGPARSATVMRDELGQPSMVMVRHEDGAISFSTLNPRSPFRTRATINLKGSERDTPGGIQSTERVAVAISEDKETATLKLLTVGQQLAQVDLSAKELEDVLTILGEARAIMKQPVPAEPPNVAGAREAVILDPAWRTNTAIHPSLDGIVLRLRHLGFGWVTFLLPPHEALALGKWLAENSKPNPQAK